jgi:uncharacterized membrane protein
MRLQPADACGQSGDMSDWRLPAVIFIFLLALGVLQCAHVYPQLPERVASHFTADGRPNGWQPKQDFFLVPAIVVGVTVLISFLLPVVLAQLPPEMINLPNKRYWLAEERRKETSRYITAHMAWFGCGLLFVVLYAVSQAVNANLPDRGDFNPQGLLLVIGAFITYAVLVLGHLMVHFYKIPES